MVCPETAPSPHVPLQAGQTGPGDDLVEQPELRETEGRTEQGRNHGLGGVDPLGALGAEAEQTQRREPSVAAGGGQFRAHRQKDAERQQHQGGQGEAEDLQGGGVDCPGGRVVLAKALQRPRTAAKSVPSGSDVGVQLIGVGQTGGTDQALLRARQQAPEAGLALELVVKGGGYVHLTRPGQPP